MVRVGTKSRLDQGRRASCRLALRRVPRRSGLPWVLADSVIMQDWTVTNVDRDCYCKQASG